MFPWGDLESGLLRLYFVNDEEKQLKFTLISINNKLHFQYKSAMFTEKKHC